MPIIGLEAGGWTLKALPPAVKCAVRAILPGF